MTEITMSELREMLIQNFDMMGIDDAISLYNDSVGLACNGSEVEYSREDEVGEPLVIEKIVS